MIIVNLSCKNDSGWFSDAKNFLERDRKWSRSNFMSMNPFLGNLDFKNSKSIDNGRISTVIMILSCEIDRGWFSDVKHCVEHDLKWLRSKAMTSWPFYWHFNHCEYIAATLRHDAKIYIRGRNSEKSRSQSEIWCTTIILESTPTLHMMSHRSTRVVLGTNNNLWNWPLCDMMCVLKVVTKPKCWFCEAGFQNGPKSVFWR